MQKILLYGQGRSNQALYQVLKKRGDIKISLSSDSDTDWCGEPGRICKKEICESDFDHIYAPPAIPCTHWLHQRFRVENELSYALSSYRGKLIGVTGANGKSTLVSLLHKWFSDRGHKTILAGNIGLPLCSRWDEIQNCEWMILELSSFQLFALDNLHFDAVCLTSYEPNHLDWHPDEEHYQSCKRKLFSMGNENCIRICSTDFPMHPENSILIGNGGDLFWNEDFVTLHSREIAKSAPRKDLQRAWALSACILDLLGFQNPVFPDFNGLEHRIEMVQTYPFLAINDSKATTFGSTLYALENVNSQNVSLILGGKSKKTDFSDFIQSLVKVKERVKKIYLYGDGKELLSPLKNAGFDPVYEWAWQEILQKISQSSHQCLLLSPGYSSLDQFPSFEKRGQSFREFIRSLAK